MGNFNSTNNVATVLPSPAFSGAVSTNISLADGKVIYTGNTTDTRGSISSSEILLKGPQSAAPSVTFLNTDKTGSGLGYYFENVGASGDVSANSFILIDSGFNRRIQFFDAGGNFFGGNTEVSGSILSSSSLGGVGYKTGAGGSVTQSTSKATGVTLNKVSGRITMSDAALPSAETVTFTLTNSTIESTDTVSISIAGGEADDGSYQILPVKTASGSCKITVWNINSISLSEALVLQFNVHKGVSS